MKQWLKVAACVTVCAAMLSITAYADGADPKAVLDAGIAKNKEGKDINITVNGSMSVAEFSNLNGNIVINLKQKNAGTSQMEYMMDTSMDVLGTRQDRLAMYHDGYAYVSSSGGKLKAAMSPAEFMNALDIDPLDNGLTSDYLQETQMRTEGGNQIISFTIDPDDISLDDGTSDVRSAVRTAGGECTVNSSGYYVGLKMNVVCDMVRHGARMTVTTGADEVVHNPGQMVDITFPDTGGYTQVSAGQMEKALQALTVFSVTDYMDAIGPKEVYNAAVRKSADLKYLDVYSYLAMTAWDGKQIENSGATVTAKLATASPLNTQYLAVLAESTDGVPYTSTTFFYHDGFYYTNENGLVKTKFPLNINEFLATAQGMKDLAPDLYDTNYDSKIAMRAEGEDTIISFHLIPKEADTYMNDILIENGGVNGEYRINKDGYFSDIKFYGTLNTPLYGEPLLTAYIYENKINNPGSVFDIEFPDMSGYQEIGNPGNGGPSEYGGSSFGAYGSGPADDNSWKYKMRQYGPAEEDELKIFYEE